VLVKLLERHGGTNDRVAIVSHGAFYNYLVTAIGGQDGQANLWLLMNNTAISRMGFEDRAVFYYHNRTDHLPREWMT
jgi:broad specificity phosphatase PhoE